ncbi:uncharacterized protein A4U43_C07F3070 [Asparagus officinalis]|uniref:Uncharacterized protein n=1 Tax=Asparagus officinalis TaxID=4686 RepID=A0A5P1EC36_ASPOF|nr:myb-related protein MYBAS2-like isoform X2 [Asparagus officinalis]ONK62359.1 uncharacterized protein A4U43_C07F3070 [Asparagus officinalis]
MVSAMKEQETRKGPWTEQEDLQLVCFVRLFGERRWDFIAKVSGLNRTGKSCRLRWVNYLHPGLKRGRMTPQEERLVLELHSKWGNRWSRIARRLPGRTDNEIKNYWRTHMRKMAQEAKRNSSPPSASSSSNSLSSMSESPAEPANADNITEGNITTAFGENEGLKVYPMDQIWNEIETSESVSGLSLEEHKDEACNMSCPPPLSSLMWDYNSESLWKIDDHEEFSMIPPMSDLLVSNYHHGKEQS